MLDKQALRIDIVAKGLGPSLFKKHGPETETVGAGKQRLVSVSVARKVVINKHFFGTTVNVKSDRVNTVGIETFVVKQVLYPSDVFSYGREQC